MKIGEHKPIIIIMPDGMKIKGVAVVSGFEERGDKITGVQYTIPNMHFNLEDNKLIKNFDGGIGKVFHGGFGSSTYVVNEPLMNIVEEE